MNSVFSVSKEHINRLSPEDCVQLFGDFLHVDARRIKLSISKVHFTSKTVPDGGIDASIEDGVSPFGDLIIDSESFYQIKSGAEYAPWQESEIKEELIGNKELKKENLGQEVQRCFERNGTYILVCMKVQLTSDQKNKGEIHLKKILESCGILNPKVKVWGQEKILGTIQLFPSITIRVSGRGADAFHSHVEWASQEEMKKTLKVGEEQKKFIQTLQTELNSDGEAIHLNFHGETGVGKTRLVFEATKDPFLSPLVVYCDSPTKIKDSELLAEIIRDETIHVILVVDECDYNNRTYLWDKLKNQNSRIKLITIHNEYVPTQGTTKQIQTPNLSDDKISEIIQTYHDDSIIANQLARICGGIPRFAHVIGWDVKHNPDELLRGTPDTNNIFNRYLNYGEDPNSDKVLQRKRVLYTVALFQKFGYSSNFRTEMDSIHDLIKKIDPNLTPAIIKEHIDQLKIRKILQGEDTLYITPKALHLWLWMKWWEDYGPLFNFEELVTSFPRQLLAWFFAMFEYAAKSDVTKSIVTGLFAPGGHLSDSKAIQTSLGAKFFQTLSSVDPQYATEYLEKTMGTWPQDELKKFTHGRREIIYGLEKIVFEPDLFTRGGTLLRSLAEAENADFSNNATRLFAGLFSLGHDYVSLTKASPTTRIQLLKETLCSENESRRNLGLKACESALQTMHFTRPLGLSGDELRLDQKGWTPKTYGEWGDAYKEIIDMMIEKIKTFPEKDQQKGAAMIFDNARGILHALPFIGGYLVDKLCEIKDFVDKETSLQSIIDIIVFDKDQLDPTIKSRLETLQVELTGTDYSSLMKRYIRMNIMMNLAKKNREEGRIKKIHELAKESLDASKLKHELEWLVTYDAKYGYVFGQKLGELDVENSLLSLILDAQKKSGDNGSGFFLSGYLLKIHEKNKESWNKLLTEFSQDEQLVRFVSELAWRSGITDDIGMLLLDLIKKNKIKANELGQFALGGVVNRLSPKVVTQWIEFMIQTNDQKIIHQTIDLFNSFFVHRQKKPLEPKLTLRLLTHDVFMGKESICHQDTMVDYYWEQIGLVFVDQFPQHALELGDKILQSMGNVSSIVASHSQPISVLNKIAFTYPNETWELVTKYIDLSFDERRYAISSWMRGGVVSFQTETVPSFLNSVDFQNIFDWIDHDPHKRASYITEHIKPELKKEHSLARELLVKYGKDEKVQKSLTANFFTGVFSGSAATYYQNKKDNILAYKETEDNENVRNWIDFYVKSLDEDIKREKLYEEREF